MSPAETEAVVRQMLMDFEDGISLDWLDIRVYLLIAVSAGLGSAIGAWTQAFLSKRGEIAAIKQDLHQITEIQEQIKVRLSRELWIDQNIWNLKRETYWKFSSILSQLSSALWDLMSQGFSPDKTIPIIQPEIILLREKIENILDEVISLTAPTHIILCAEAIQVLETFQNNCGELHKQLGGRVATYAFFDSLKRAVDIAYNEIIDIAKSDLQGRLGTTNCKMS